MLERFCRFACLLAGLVSAAGLLVLAAEHGTDRGGPARTGAYAVSAVRTPPTIAWSTALRFRDWGSVVRVDGMVIGTNATGQGGLFAIDEASGRLTWRAGRTHALHAPVSDGTRLIVTDHNFPKKIAAYAVATGKLIWTRNFEFLDEARQALGDGVIYMEHRDGNLYALDAATGTERWHFNYGADIGRCGTLPVLADGIVYFGGGSDGGRDRSGKKAQAYQLWAVDAATGQEKWRYLAPDPEEFGGGACLREIISTGRTLIASGAHNLYAVDRVTGRQQWTIEVPDGEKRAEVHGLVYTGDTLYGVTDHFLGAFDPHSGRTTWTLPGTYRTASPATAAANGVLYFQGNVKGTVLPDNMYAMNALDLATRQVLWSFTYPPAGAWAFGDVLPVDGAIYVDTALTLLKLH